MIKLTTKQKEILKTLQSLQGFCTTQEIHKKIPHIDLTTVYRALEKFYQKDIVQKIILHNQEAAYEYSKDKHHHSLCKTCKKIEHIKLNTDLLRHISELKHFKPETVEVFITGACNKKTDHT